MAKNKPRGRRSPTHGQTTKAKAPPHDRPKNLTPPSLLKPDEQEFCLIYLTNGFNATAAYKATHPACLKDAAARASASRLLTNANVKAYLAERLDDRWKPLHMTGDEVLALVAGDARADLRLLVNEQGQRLGLEELPDSLANSLEAVEFDEAGKIAKVKLVSKASSRRTILEVTGKVSGDKGVDEIAAAMRETLEMYKSVK